MKSESAIKCFVLLLSIDVGLVGSVFCAEVADDTQSQVDFAHDVLPLLKAACAQCHTNDNYKGSLSLDTRESLLESGVVDIGDSGASELVNRITSDDPEIRMPLEHDPLTAEQIAIIRVWIDQGLPWEDGFTFKESTYEALLAPRRPELPPAHNGCTNPIDRLLEPYLATHEIVLEPITDSIFVRRVFLDLIGLLPTPAETEHFLADPRPDKRDELVRTLLHRDRDYAEHWLTFWNDLLRNDYAGTGYVDGGRKQITSWLYQALMENMPYDTFVRELISPSPDAEGFINGIKWRGRVNASQTREIQFSQNVSQIFLGINLKCASCHDSFINQWKLADAYGLAAVVANEPLELHRCDKPTGKMATVSFLYPELGEIDSALSRAERLKQLALLLTHKENGRLTRTIVNRIWHRMMGRGLVHPVDEMDNRPWNADLLDYLAVELADTGYDLKKTIELIATSQAYQSQCEIVTEKSIQATDYTFRGPIAHRLTAEQLYDALWRITGTAPEKPVAEVGERTGIPVRAALVKSDLLMRSLGRPNREQVVTTRPTVLSTLQSLDLSNGESFHALLHQGAENLLAQWDGQADTLIQQVYLAALTRLPTESEMDTCLEIVGTSPNTESVADLLWVVFMLPEFQMIR